MLLQGVCAHGASCPHSHAAVHPDAPICPNYRAGYCRRGTDCPLKHFSAETASHHEAHPEEYAAIVAAAKQRGGRASPSTGAFANGPLRPSSRLRASANPFSPAAPGRPPSRADSAAPGAKDATARGTGEAAGPAAGRQGVPAQVPMLLRDLPDPQYPGSDPVLYHIGGILVFPDEPLDAAPASRGF